MDKHLGVYVHIPFCASKCHYCDFYSLPGCEKQMPRYQQALLRHIRESAPVMEPYYVDTLYFGGGTPSYYGAARITELFAALKRSARILKSAEVTVECNPDSVTKRSLAQLRREGVNRLSLGMQSGSDELLKILGRRHSHRQTEAAVRAAREEGFDNLSLDLMFGLPGQSRTDWAHTLEKAITLNPEHISCYGLQLEEGTPLYERYHDDVLLPSQDEQADMYLFAVETLGRYGYGQYEISNFAKPGFESRHNMKYWDLDDYIGFGPGAHSCVADTRYSFRRDLQDYIRAIDAGESVLDEWEVLSPMERAAEYIMLGMRRGRGISGAEYHRIYRSDFEPIETLLKDYERRGWARFLDGRWAFTPSGFLLSNVLIGSLLEAQAACRGGTLFDEADCRIDPDTIRVPAGGEVY